MTTLLNLDQMLSEQRRPGVRASVVVPWRATPARAPVWDWLRRYWAVHLPDWQLIEGRDDGVPFSKPRAANEGVRRAVHDVVVVLDADVLLPAGILYETVAAIQAGAPWATPLDRAFRLSEERTRLLLQSDPVAPNWPVRHGSGGRILRPWKHAAMVVVCRRADYAAIGGMEERLRGHAADDSCLRASLRSLVGPQVEPDREWVGFHLHCTDAVLNGSVAFEHQTREHVSANMSLTWRYLNAAKAADAGDHRAAYALRDERLARWNAPTTE